MKRDIKMEVKNKPLVLKLESFSLTQLLNYLTRLTVTETAYQRSVRSLTPHIFRTCYIPPTNAILGTYVRAYVSC